MVPIYIQSLSSASQTVFEIWSPTGDRPGEIVLFRARGPTLGPHESDINAYTTFIFSQPAANHIENKP